MSDYEFSFLYSILNGFQPNPRYYTCNNSSFIISVPHPFLGSYFFISGLILITLYSICAIAIAKSELMRTPAYKIMLVLAIYDIASLFINSIATGIFGFFGTTFCANKMLFFTIGALALWFWLGSCITCTTLAINRCCDLNPQLKLWVIFNGNRIYGFIAIFILYGLYGFLFSKPIIFHSQYMSWFFDPLIGTDPSLYANYLQATNNLIVSLSTILLYIYICVIIVKKSSIGSSSFSKTQKQIILQSILICSCHTVATFIYVYMQFFASPAILIIIAQIGWQFCNSKL